MILSPALRTQPGQNETSFAHPQGEVLLYPRAYGISEWLSWRQESSHHGFPEPSAIQAPAFHQGSNGLQAVVR